jgi:hypothetical protein
MRRKIPICGEGKELAIQLGDATCDRMTDGESPVNIWPLYDTFRATPSDTARHFHKQVCSADLMISGATVHACVAEEEGCPDMQEASRQAFSPARFASPAA